jgi:predicted Zn-dependent peptidase
VRAIILGTLLTLVAVAAAAPPPDFYALPDNIETLQLENGLQVVLMPNTAQPMAGVYVVVGVGSSREDFATSGMSHMLEHLLFNGTDTMTQEQLYDAADLAGAYNNANTADFHTSFMMVVPAANLETGMRLQSQMLLHSALPPEKFEKERGIILGELVAARDDPTEAAGEEQRRALNAGTSLELPTLGTRATIAGLDRDATFAFYKTWYVPNNMTLTLAGNFDRDGALKLIETYYGAVSPRPLPDAALRTPAPLDESRTLVRRAGRERKLTLAFDAPDYRSDDYFAFEVATELLQAEGSGIFSRAVADLAHQPEVGLWWQAAPGFGRVMIEMTLPEGFAGDDGYRLVQDAIATALENGITDEDVAEVVHLRETTMLQDREQLRMTGIVIAEPLWLGGVDFFVASLPRLRAVTAADVAVVLEERFIGRPCLAVLLEPELTQPAAVPAALPAPAMPAGMKMPAGQTMPPKMAEAMRKMSAEGAAGEAVAKNDPAYKAPGGGAPAVPVDRSVLPSGAILVSQTVAGSDLMAIHLTMRGRALIDRAHGAPGAVNLVHRLLTTGVKGCDETCLARRLRQMGAVVKLVDDPRFPMDDYYTSGRFSFVRIECPAASGPDVLTLLADLTRRVTFAKPLFEREQRAQLQIFADRQGSASAEAGRMLRDALYGDHPLAQPAEGTAASVQALTPELLRAVYADALAPANLIWTVVSPYSHDELKTQLTDLLPGTGTPTAGVPPLPETTAPNRLTAAVGGEMAAIRLGAIRAVEPVDAVALELLVAIMSDRIQMDLRESKGLSYSLGASADIIGGEMVFQAYLNPPVERAGEGEELLTAAIKNFDAASITQADLDKTRGARGGRTMMRHLSSIGRAYYLAMAELEHDLAGYAQAVSAYDKVTLTDLQRVASSYLKDLPLVTVVVN